MSRPSPEVVRQPLAVADRSRRRWEQHFLRFPRVVALVAQAIWRVYLLLPARSRVRRALPRRYIQQGLEALNRGDLGASFMLYHQDVESIFPPGVVSLGLEPVYRGRNARVDAQRLWNSQWGDWRFEPEQLFDFGDNRFLVIGSFKGSGLSSGAVVANEGAFLLTLSGGQVIREQFFLDHRVALEAAGLGVG